jgi:hypothetical protein
MTEQISLKDLEKSVFKSSIQDGIIDIQIGSYLLIFAIAPLLSRYLGDFWSSVIFLPFWGGIFLILRTVRKKLIQPRIGKIEYGQYRKKKLTRLNIIILVFNIAALILGILSFLQFAKLPDWIISLRLSIILLVGFSLAGFMLDFNRLYLYGILIAAAPLVGEYLYQNHGFLHHGSPVTFGFLAALMILIGTIIIVRILKNYPLPGEELPNER